MKPIDYIIVAAVIGAFYLAYAGHRIVAVFVATAVITVSGWRFWDRSRVKHFMRGSSGDNLPDKDDATYGTDDHPSHDGGSADGGGDAGGD